LCFVYRNQSLFGNDKHRIVQQVVWTLHSLICPPFLFRTSNLLKTFW
jgi:hypothetical protein